MRGEDLGPDTVMSRRRGCGWRVLWME